VILLSAIWRSPAIPLSPGCSTFLRDLHLLFPSAFHHFSIIWNLPSLSGNILQFPDSRHATSASAASVTATFGFKYQVIRSSIAPYRFVYYSRIAYSLSLVRTHRSQKAKSIWKCHLHLGNTKKYVWVRIHADKRKQDHKKCGYAPSRKTM
jgi:hypothetical protein